ncbi:MAG: stalk domain-containing protein, partial [Oscillospiraceae bacterium]
YGNPLNGWDKHILDTARSRNVAVEIAWNIQEEGLGLAKIPDQTKLITDFLEELNEYSDVPMFLRIGAEMNIWEDKANPKEFITAFRHIANLVREKTDHIATVWSVSHASEWNTNMEDFYPGDEYVDWIGISAYMVKHFQGKEWKKSERHNEVTYSAGDAADPIMVINEVMTKFGDRKPVMLAECGSARYTTSLKEDSTNWAVTNMERMYTYVPMVYPQVKLIAYFNTYFEGETSDYKIEGHPKMQDTYNKLIEQPHFIQNSFNNSAQLTYKPVKDGLEVENGSLPIYTYPHVYGDAEPSVNYYIDGNFAGTSNKLPYKQWLDFSQYSVGTHKVKSVVYSHGIEVASTEANVSKKRSINVKINDEVLKTSVTPVMENDRILVPMRDIFEALGAEVTWDDGTRTATGIKDDIQVSITINENTLVKNGKKIELDVSSKLINEKTMVPIRAISEAFEATVTWNDETSTVSINI